MGRRRRPRQRRQQGSRIKIYVSSGQAAAGSRQHERHPRQWQRFSTGRPWAAVGLLVSACVCAPLCLGCTIRSVSHCTPWPRPGRPCAPGATPSRFVNTKLRFLNLKCAVPTDMVSRRCLRPVARARAGRRRRGGAPLGRQVGFKRRRRCRLQACAGRRRARSRGDGHAYLSFEMARLGAREGRRRRRGSRSVCQCVHVDVGVHTTVSWVSWPTGRRSPAPPAASCARCAAPAARRMAGKQRFTCAQGARGRAGG